ncbi:MAG: TonB-dependent receptor [Porticoccaceae bacterium]
MTLIIPFDVVKTITTNELIGEFRIEDAIEILLDGTGLQATVNKHKQLKISKSNSFGGVDMDKNKVRSGGLLALVASLFAGGTAAQDAGAVSGNLAAGRVTTIEEVVVTARRAEEGLQRTPVAVTALNEDMLVKAQVMEVADLRRTAPNVSILSGGTGASTLVFVAIRGQANTSPGAAGDASVGTYIDGVYYARPTSGNVDMFDVQQAEILRGPQGTLFGRNTTGGALTITTNNPTGVFEGYVKADVGNFNSRKLEAVVNLPIIGEELAARFAYRTSEHDGYRDYAAYGDPAGFVWNGFRQKANEVDQNDYGRVKLLWDPADLNIALTLGADWNEYRDTGQSSEVMAINEDFVAGPFNLGELLAMSGFNSQHFIDQQKWNKTYWNVDASSTNPAQYNAKMAMPVSTNRSSGVFASLDVDLGNYQLKSITSYREARSTVAGDIDGLPVNLVTFYSIWDQHQWSQEFQLSGTWGESLDWIAGLYYFDERSSDVSIDRSFGIFSDLFAPGIPLELGGAPFNVGSDGVFDNISSGVFVQANYQFTDNLRGTAGVRYTRDDRDVEWRGTAPAPGQMVPPVCIVSSPDKPGVCSQTDSTTFEYPAWTLGLDYQVNDRLFLYAKTSGASMSGGWNVRATTAPAFGPEEIKDIEVGFKSDLFDHRLRLNAAFFHSWSKDLQRFVNEWDPVVNSLTQYIRNAGKAKARGAEFELTWLPWEGMQINTNLAFLDTEYDTYDVQEVLTTGPNAGSVVVVDHSREKMPQAPKRTLSVGATQTLMTALGELDLHADYFWVDDTWFQDTTIRPGESEELQAQFAKEKKWNAIPAYGLVNAQATLRFDDGNWELSLWGKNLADKEYYTSVSNFYTAFGASTWYKGAPRTFGASVRYSW